MKVVVCERFLNVQTSKQHGKKWQLVGGPYHCTTGMVVIPALLASDLENLLSNSQSQD